MKNQEDTFLKLKQIPFKEARKLYLHWLKNPGRTIVQLQFELREVGWKWKEFMDHLES